MIYLFLSHSNSYTHTHTHTHTHTIHLKSSSRGVSQKLVLLFVVDHDPTVERKKPLVEGLVDVRLLEYVALEDRSQEILAFQEMLLVVKVDMVMVMTHGA